MSYDKFYNLKLVQEEWGNNFNVNEYRNQVKWHDVKVFRLEKEHPLTFFTKILTKIKITRKFSYVTYDELKIILYYSQMV